MNRFFKLKYVFIIIILSLTVFFSWQLKKVKIDNTVRIFIPDDHPSNIAFDRVEELFGGSDRIIIGIEDKKNTILTINNINLINDITLEVEALENVQDVSSLTSVDFVDGTEYGMEVSDLIEDMPQTEQEIALIKEKIQSWEIYENNIISKDFTLAGIVVDLEPALDIKDKEAVYAQIETVLDQFREDSRTIYVAGEPALIVVLGQLMVKDVLFLTPFVILILLIFLAISFKKAGGVIYPTITVIISTTWVMGIMCMLGISLTLVSTVIPVLLIAVGSAYSIHMISHYYDELRKVVVDLNHPLNYKQNKRIVFLTVKRIFKPIVLSALTTMAGFGSLATSPIIPIKIFGVFTALGVFIVLIISLSFIPSLLIVSGHFSFKRKMLSQKAQNKQTTVIEIISGQLDKIIFKYKYLIIMISLVLILVSALATFRIKVDSTATNYFRDNIFIKQASEYLNNNFGGTSVLDVIIEAEQAGDLKNPHVLKAMDNLKLELLSQHDARIGKIISFADILKRMNKVMHYDAPEGMEHYNEIPYDAEKYNLQGDEGLKRLISQYLFIYGGELDDFLDNSDDPKVARMIIQIKSNTTATVAQIKKDIEQYTQTHFPKGYQVSVSGWSDIELTVNELTIKGQILNIIVSLVIVFLILVISFRSFSIGFMGIIPLSVAVLINFGILGLFGIVLDIGTAMISAIAIGIGIDYAIHMISGFSHELEKSRDIHQVTKNVIQSSGKAIIYNALSVALGFAVLIFSNFIPLIYLGVLVSITMITSSLAAIIIIPILFVMFNKKAKKRVDLNQ